MANTLPLAVLVMLSFAVLSFAACTPDDEQVQKAEDVVFVSPEPQNTPLKIAEHLLETSDAPLLSATHMSEDVSLCFNCHTKEKLYTRESNLIFSHERHLRKEIVCSTCHFNEGAIVYTPVKEDCIACHTDRGISTSCKTCHKDTKILEPESHKGGDFRHLHGKVGLDLKTCSSCHGVKRFCYDCHGVEMPHSDDYLLIHPSQVQGKPTRCSLCHGRQPCESCHSERGITF